MSSACQRAVLTCARCRKRKIKCDRLLPSCSLCLKAGETCLGISPNSDEAPRSLLLSLESEIRKLENELENSGQLETINASEILLQMPFGASPPRPSSESNDPGESSTNDSYAHKGTPLGLTDEEALNATVLSSNFMQAFVSPFIPRRAVSSDLLLKIRLGMTPSSSSISSANEENLHIMAREGNGEVESKVLASMPPEVVRTLLREYIAIILPHHPFLSATAICTHLEHASVPLGWNENPRPERSTVMPSHHLLIVYLVLAIAVTLGIAKGGDEKRCISLASSLFTEGSGHLGSLNDCPSEIVWLQTMLLMILYATVIPRSANVWILSGAAMRACVELGLHREVPAGFELGMETRNMRRVIFWATYCMDRSICSALQQPSSTPDTAIDVQLPTQTVEKPFLSSIKYHRLLSEMVQVHFQGEDLPEGATWDTWMASMEGRLRKWHEENRENTSKFESYDFLLARGLMMLHRPSPRVPMPSNSSLLVAFEAASTSAQAIHIQIESGSFRRPWISAHHTLEAAMVTLFCLRHSYQAIRERFTASQIFQMTKLSTTNFLVIAGQGWPEVSNYGGVYERLLNSLLEPLFSSTAAPPQLMPAEEAELMRLLYPSAAQLEKLRRGHKLQLDKLGSTGTELWDIDFDFLGWEITGEDDGSLLWGTEIYEAPAWQVLESS